MTNGNVAYEKSVQLARKTEKQDVGANPAVPISEECLVELWKEIISTCVDNEDPQFSLDLFTQIIRNAEERGGS